MIGETFYYSLAHLNIFLDKDSIILDLEIYINKVPNKCQTILGPDYALLRNEFSRLHNKMEPNTKLIERVLIFFGGILIFFMRQAQGGNSQAMNFGRNRAKMFLGNQPAVSFSDVAGVEEAKIELEEIVEFLKLLVIPIC